MRGNEQNQLKISAPHPMTETYRLIPLLAALISLDSPFKLSLDGLHLLKTKNNIIGKAWVTLGCKSCKL
jgi:hypothetical protein